MFARLRLSSLFSAFLPQSTAGSNAKGISSMAATNGTTHAPEKVEVAMFGSGCFWGTEHIFLKHYPIKDNKGILKTTVGFTGGHDTENISYRAVCDGDTGHAEACRIEFDPSIISYAELIEFFYRTHDPTQLNRQGNDRGSQYRSAIFYSNDEQLDIAKQVTDEIQKKHFDSKGQKIATTIEPFGKWYDAEDYHQEYLFKNPHGYQCPTHRLHW